MTYRVFPSGQVPTAEVLQKYLMDQVVIGCVSTARPPNPTQGMTVFETDTGTFRVWQGGVWARFAHVGDWNDAGHLTVPGGLAVTGDMDATADVGAATATITGLITMGGLPVSRLVKGKVSGTQTDTTIGTGDTNIIGGNVQNVPVIAGRAYRSIVSVDYNTGSSASVGRLDFKLWNGTVGTSQLGGTIRAQMTGAAGSASNRNLTMVFIWQAPSTTTIANINMTALCSVAGNVAQINAAFSHMVEEIGLASTITNL